MSMLLLTASYGQGVGINTTGANPNANAMLDVDAAGNDKGILIPRVTSAQRAAIAGLGAGDEGLTVYDETTNSYWLWDGTQWVEFEMSGNAWDLGGNAGTTPGTDYVGTSDGQDLVFKTNNTEVVRYYSTGEVEIDNLAGVGNRMVIADANGELSTQAIPTGDITAVTAGAGITGGGTTGTVTLTAAADNGLYVNAGADRIRLGGTLVEATTLTHGTFNLTHNLNSTGDFFIQDNGVNTFEVRDNGITLFGDDVYWRDGNTAGTNLAILSDDGDDGRFRIYENGITSVDLDANTQFIFNEQGLDRNFRIESDGVANMFVLDAGVNRVSIGTATNAGTFNVLGNSYFSDDIYLRDGAVNGGDILVRIYDSADDGIIDVFQNSAYNHRIHGNGTTVFNEQGLANGDVRMESDTRTNMFWLDANENIVRFGTGSAASDSGNGSTVAGTLVEYVADFDRGGASGTAIGIGSIEYILDGSAETLINNAFSPTTHLVEDLGNTLAPDRFWDDVYADDYWVPSDITIKHSIKELPYGLKEVMGLEPISYVLNEDPYQEPKIGLSAQQTLTLVPEAVKTHNYRSLDENNPEVKTKVEMENLAMSYQTLIPVLIKATQEQQEIIEDQNEKIELLMEELEEIKKLLQQ